MAPVSLTPILAFGSSVLVRPTPERDLLPIESPMSCPTDRRASNRGACANAAAKSPLSTGPTRRSRGSMKPRARRCRSQDKRAPRTTQRQRATGSAGGSREM